MTCANGIACSPGEDNVRNNSPRAPLFLPPGFAGSAGQRERDDYARSRGEGESAGKRSASQRSGAPGDVRSPADGHKQAGFTPAVKRNARRASDAGRTACLVQTGLRSLLRSARSEIIPP